MSNQDEIDDYAMGAWDMWLELGGSDDKQERTDRSRKAFKHGQQLGYELGQKSASTFNEIDYEASESWPDSGRLCIVAWAESPFHIDKRPAQHDTLVKFSGDAEFPQWLCESEDWRGESDNWRVHDGNMPTHWTYAPVFVHTAKPGLENSNGVKIGYGRNFHGHALVWGAMCECGSDLVASPSVLSPDHEEGNPEVTCTDFAHKSYWFADLVMGKQEKEKPLEVTTVAGSEL